MNLETDQGRLGPLEEGDGACSRDRTPAGRGGTAPPEGTRFEADPYSTVDRLTGLVWARDGALSEFPLSWAEASEFVAALNSPGFGGLKTWRLPQRDELFSLVSHRMTNPALPCGHPFTNVFNGYYWTATTSARLPDQAWYVHLGGGRVQRGMKHGSYMLLPVASPPTPTAVTQDRFTVKGEVVQDRLTNRSWLLGGPAPGKALNWQEAHMAVEACNAARAAGFDDWRLPTIRELDTLTDMRRHSPAVADGFPPESLPQGLWSATTSAYEPSYAWVLYCMDGAIGVGHKPRKDFHFVGVRP